MRLMREPTITHGVLLLLIALGALWHSGRDYRAAQQRYAAVASAPVADYVVYQRRMETVGSGKSRRTYHLLGLTLAEPNAAAMPATILSVTNEVYARSRNGDHWRGRLTGVADEPPLFDPQLTGVERRGQRLLRVMAVIFAVAGVAVVVAARRGRG